MDTLKTLAREVSNEQWLELIRIRWDRIKGHLGDELPLEGVDQIKCLFKDNHEVPFGRPSNVNSHLPLALNTRCYPFDKRRQQNDPVRRLNGTAQVIFLTETQWGILEFTFICSGNIGDDDTEESALAITLKPVTPEQLIKDYGFTPKYLFMRLNELLKTVLDVRENKFKQTGAKWSIACTEDAICEAIQP